MFYVTRSLYLVFFFIFCFYETLLVANKHQNNVEVKFIIVMSLEEF